MRLLLDANLSPRRVGRPLREASHDILALASHAELEGISDPQVLELATDEGRVLVTRNSRHFSPLSRQWAEAGRSHAGLILIWGLDHNRFAEILAGVERLLAERPSMEDWRDLTLAF